MADNNFLTVGWISMEILRILQNSLEVADAFSTDWESDFGKSFAVGSSVQVKLPQRFLVTDGLGYQPQGLSRIATTVNLDQIFGIHFEWDSYERMVKMERSEEELREQYFKPAGAQLAQEFDSRAAQFAYQNASNVFGALGTDASTINQFTAAEARLFQKACPKGKKKLCLTASLQKAYTDANVTQFNPSSEISKMYKTGLIGQAAGWEWYRSNSLYQHTIGTAPTSGVTVVGAGQSGSTLLVIGTNTQTIKKGDKFSIANVNMVNPSTRRVSGSSTAQHFTATADLTLTGGNDTLNILPAMFGPGSQYQNVDALPADTAALTFWPGTGTPSGKSGTVSLGLGPQAFAIAGANKGFEVPKAVERAEMTTDPDTGIGIRFIRAWDQRESKMTNRFDTCVGFGNLYQDNAAVALAGA